MAQIRRRWREHVEVCMALMEVLAEQELITRVSWGVQVDLACRGNSES